MIDRHELFVHFQSTYRLKTCASTAFLSQKKGKQYLCLTILAAAALREEERGEAEDGEDERADNHGSGEVQIGTGLAGAFSEYGYG